jgi:hypothetical protein
MKTIKTLVEAAKAKGFKFEVQYPVSDIVTGRTFDNLVFRFHNGRKNSYTWFNFTTIGFDELENECTFIFEAYNQNTGKSIKSFKKQFSALETLGLV